MGIPISRFGNGNVHGVIRELAVAEWESKDLFLQTSATTVYTRFSRLSYYMWLASVRSTRPVS